MKIGILGYGVEGKATLKFLKKKYPKAEFSILDRNRDPSYIKNLESFDILYRSPGVPYNLKEVQKAIRKGVVVTSATEAFLKGARGTVIGVTGTKGKSTTATLIYNILKDVNRDVYLAGNIGKPMLDLLPQLRKDSISVLELSSFQLQGIDVSPNIAVVLDIFPDHLDLHKNFDEYVDSKSNITKHQKKEDVVFYESDSKTASLIADKSVGQHINVPPSTLPVGLQIRGRHNMRNAAMAAAVASYLDVSPVSSLETISSFKGLPFRLKFTKKIRGVSFYNDSASTNPHTTVAALKSFPGNPKILIAGGRDKNLDYKPLGKALPHETIKKVILFGENKDKIKNAIGSSVSVDIAMNLEKALRAASSYAEKGDVVIFSPASSSFDMFENYKERGKEFDRLVKKLAH